MLDPDARWAGIGHRPEWGGLPTYAGLPYATGVEALAGVDVAIVGAPFDELTTDRPGARFGPRAIRAASLPPGRHVIAGVDPLEVLRVIDYGDAPVMPHDPRRAHAAIEAQVREVVGAGVLPIILGGDHSITEPDVRACAADRGMVGLVHFDTHTDTAPSLYGRELSHGTPMFRLVAEGIVDPRRYVQIGLRGYWPGVEEFGWQERLGIRHFTSEDVADLGVPELVGRVLELLGPGPVFLTVDVDVLDPAYAPGTGTPEPGGLTARELLRACRLLAAGLDVIGADVVEVLPEKHGTADFTALVGDRIVREILTGLALRSAERGVDSAA
jgi:agmatinase